jgi:hypothetical protein
VDIEFHQAFVAHLQKQGLAGFLIRKIGAPHELVGPLRLLAERTQDILAIFQHNCSCNPKPAVMMTCSGHDEFDLAIFNASRFKRGARHLFDNRPICEKIFLGQRLRRQLGLQNAALPRIPVRDLKGHRLRPLDNLLFGGLGSYPHQLFLCDVWWPCSQDRHALPRLSPAATVATERGAAVKADRRRPLQSAWVPDPRLVGVADRFGQHEAQLILGHRRLPRGR